MKSLPFKFKIKHFSKLPSTNTYARQQAELGAEEGLVFWADFQTGGRGQFDRKWESAPGKNLLFSILLRPPISPAKAPIITQIACHSVAGVLKEIYGIENELKRPNDVLVQKKKICGILTESSSRSPKKVDDVIIGIGLNINQTPAGVPEAICMKEVLGKELNPQEVLGHLLERLQKDLLELYAHPA
jgi:BirA family biotin operon repressor/biotin-[acetyl-CoA-carboxylase] ligase